VLKLFVSAAVSLKATVSVPPFTSVPIALLSILTVTGTESILADPVGTTSNPHEFSGEPRVIVGFERNNGEPSIEVAIFPNGWNVGVGVGDAPALGDGVTLEAVLTAEELDVVVADVVVDEVCVLAICGLVWVGEVQPAIKIAAITAITANKEERLFLMLFVQIALPCDPYIKMTIIFFGFSGHQVQCLYYALTMAALHTSDRL
jgi:hypothetical protein